jgi:hypothetical protein
VEPPLLDDAVYVTSTCVPLPVFVAVPIVGAVGTVAAVGVTLLDAALAALAPCALLAFTVKVYAVPFVSPDTVIGELDPDPVILPGEDVAV